MFPLPAEGATEESGFVDDAIGADIAPEGIGAPETSVVASKSSSELPPRIFIFKLFVRLTLLLLATLLLLSFRLCVGKFKVET
jgi:hypothetical protein